MSEWISVDDRLPEFHQSVIVGRKASDKNIPSSMAAVFDGHDFRVFVPSTVGKKYQNPTHWMPLPEPPEPDQ